MIAFAGHPLICDDRVVGVTALFSRREFTRATLDALDAVADIIATGIAHWTAVDALHATEERFDLAVRGSGAGLWDGNVLTGRIDFSPRFKEMLGYEVAEMEDTFALFQTRLHPEDHDRVLAAVADHLERRVPYAVDYRLRTKSGEYRWFHARGQAIWSKAGKATRMLGSITDITDRKRSEERFRLLVEASPDALVITDRRGVIVMVNAQTEKLFGYRREELIGQAVVILVPERFRSKHVPQCGAYVENPHVRPMERLENLFGRHRDGHEFAVDISLSPVETEEGLLIAAAVHDVSEPAADRGAARQRIDVPPPGRELHRHDLEARPRGDLPLRLAGLPEPPGIRTRGARRSFSLRVHPSRRPRRGGPRALGHSRPSGAPDGLLPHPSQGRFFLLV